MCVLARLGTQESLSIAWEEIRKRIENGITPDPYCYDTNIFGLLPSEKVVPWAHQHLKDNFSNFAMEILSRHPSHLDCHTLQAFYTCLCEEENPAWHYAIDALLRLGCDLGERSIECVFQMLENDNVSMWHRGFHILSSIEASLNDDHINKLLEAFVMSGDRSDYDSLMLILHRIKRSELPHIIGRLVEHEPLSNLYDHELEPLCREVDDEGFEKMCKDLWNVNEKTKTCALRSLAYMGLRHSRAIAEEILELLAEDRFRKDAIFAAARLASVLSDTERKQLLDYVYHEDLGIRCVAIESLSYLADVIEDDHIERLLESLIPLSQIPDGHNASVKRIEQRTLNRTIVESVRFLANRITSKGKWRILHVYEDLWYKFEPVTPNFGHRKHLESVFAPYLCADQRRYVLDKAKSSKNSDELYKFLELLHVNFLTDSDIAELIELYENTRDPFSEYALSLILVQIHHVGKL